jgi:hypothetical protein
MSLFLQTLAFRGICSWAGASPRTHESGGPAEARRQAVMKTASRFAGAGELKKRRVETCIRRYEQHESFQVT